MNELLYRKQEHLKAILRQYGSVAVAFSGGVDSTFLLKVAHDELGERAVALTVHACFVPGRELREAEDFCRQENIGHHICKIDESEIEGFAENPRNRCYLCKKALFERMQKMADACSVSCVAEGSNVDDLGDYRPGLKAIAELGIKSPLREAGLTKSDIRTLSRELGLPTWEKPSFACLASRFAYGETINKEKLAMVERAEQLLLDYGFRQMRVRIHGRMARIEVLPEEFPKLLEEKIRTDVVEKLISYGFSYVTMDLKGYRTGSMNEDFFRMEEKSYG